MSEPKNSVNRYVYFPTPIYTTNRPDFLPAVNQVSEENISIARDKTINELYPVYMSNSYYNDPRLEEFSKFITTTAWSILNDQGYYMADKEAFFTEMWTQEHYKHSMMEQHTHKFGSQIVGFYFLETPEGCSRLLIHDPRPAKIIIGLEETDPSNVSDASDIINFELKSGTMIFTNGWLPHSFDRHGSDDPIKFVHFNLNVRHASMAMAIANDSTPAAEVI